ncbi:hypothetical protein ACFVFS_37730 [Kitasatospora sp. NPDC057692]|uniref:cell envelope integrity protein TolA n=1 Tax=Kitasatospora sp. NPDC057692 TaxID=3346215 RepID=UPI00368D6023
MTRSDTAAATAARNHETAQAAIRNLNWAGPEGLRDALATIEELLPQDHSVEDHRNLDEALAAGQRRLTLQTHRRTEVMIQLRRTEPGTLSRELLEEARQLTSDPSAPEEDRALVAELSAQYRAEAEQRLATARQQRILAEQQEKEALQQQRAELRHRQEQARAEQEARAEREALAEQEARAEREALAEQEARAEREALAEQEAPQQSTQDDAPAVPRRWETPKAAAKYAELAKPLLGALKKAAREGATRTWESIADRTGTKGLRELGYPAKVEVLVIAESGTPADRPLWSVVLAAAGSQEALAIHRAVCERLQRPLPDTDAALRTRLNTERTILRHGW